MANNVPDDDELLAIIDRCRGDTPSGIHLEPLLGFVESVLAAPVLVEGVEIRGVILGGSKVSSEIRMKKGDAIFTILVSEEVARRIGAFVGDRGSLLFRVGS